MKTNRKMDICICEPFMISGPLPTLAPAIIKAALERNGFRAKVFYPSLQFFITHNVGHDPLLMRLTDNIPVQIIDYFFSFQVNEQLDQTLDELSLTEPEKQHLMDLRTVIQQLTDECANEIVACQPTAVCCSLTFGGYNFTNYLFTRVKQTVPGIQTIVGGSCCTVDQADSILAQIPSIDYVICDETTFSLERLVSNLIRKTEYRLPTVASACSPALHHLVAENLDDIDCPDFSDFISETDRLGLIRESLTLPYEISRGCWWCERKPCTMCGFYGIRKRFIIKSPQKVISDLQHLKEIFGIYKFRFSDLVQPQTDYLKKLQPLSGLHLKLFWELRPDIDETDLQLMKHIGLSFAQIGIESLDWTALKLMNKGTTPIHNIYLLLLFEAYKIDVYWNYLYGFPWDTAEQYRHVVELIPSILHLQPPMIRKVWINKYSDWYLQITDTSQSSMQSKFQDVTDSNFRFFLSGPEEQETVKTETERLKMQVSKWVTAKRNNYSMLLDARNPNVLTIRRYYETEQSFRYAGNKRTLYLFCLNPQTVQTCVEHLGIQTAEVETVLQEFLFDKTMLFTDGFYLSLAVQSTPYRWDDPEKQVLLYQKEESNVSEI